MVDYIVCTESINFRRILIYKTERKIEAIWARILTFYGLVLILTLTIFPFNGLCGGIFIENWSLQNAIERFSWEVSVGRKSDFILNVILFLVMGFGVAGLHNRIHAKAARTITLFTVTLIGVVCSVTIETIQIFLPFRHPSVTDVLANGLGTLLGGYGYVHFGRAACRTLSSFSVKLTSNRYRQIIFSVVFTYLVFGLLLSDYQRRQISLDTWDESYHLAIGNEVTGDRPWRGSVTQVHFSSGVATDEIVNCLLSVGISSTTCKASHFISAESAELAHYSLSSFSSSIEAIEDKTGRNPPMTWQISGNDAGADTNERLKEQIWLQSKESVIALNRHIASSGSFTIFVEAKTDNLHQTGPARIVTVSKSVTQRNFTMGQQSGSLVVRLRTSVHNNPNGTKPAFIVKNVWKPDRLQRIVVGVDNTKIKIYIDDISNEFNISLGPEVSFFSTVAPTFLRGVCLNSTGLWPAKIVYWFLFFSPVILILPFLYIGSRNKGQAMCKIKSK